MTKYKSAFDAIMDTPIQSANLKMRSELMSHIQAIIHDMHGTQAQIARKCGITQPRLNDLLNGKVSKFSLDALVNINASLEQEISLSFATVC